MDALGDRIKTQYENRTRYYLPRRTYTIVRVDGKAFHTLTRGLERPFHQGFMDCMDGTAQYLVNNMDGSVFSYVQSDEISVLLTDFKNLDTQAWFDGNLQKICSVSASMATAAFNYIWQSQLAHFDSRAFTIADKNEVANYFIWRTRDCIRNSINMVGQTYFSTNEMSGKSIAEVQDMLVNQKGVNWNNFPPREKSGVIFTRNGKINVPTTDVFNFYLGLMP